MLRYSVIAADTLHDIVTLTLTFDLLTLPVADTDGGLVGPLFVFPSAF